MRVNEKAVSGSETEEHAKMTSGAAGAQQPAQYPDVHMPFEPGMYHVMPNAVSLQFAFCFRSRQLGKGSQDNILVGVGFTAVEITVL